MHGAAGACRPKPSGRKRRAATTGGAIRGATRPRTEAHAIFGRPSGATASAIGRPGGAGPYGVHDLLGNLREWTATIPKPYPYQHQHGDGRESFTDAGRVVVRGASHDDPEDALSVTRRWSYDRRRAASGQHVVGFRCATSDDLGEVAPGGRR